MSKEGNYRGWVIVAVSFLILMFIFATCISCMGVYLKPVTDEFGISRTDFSLITTMQAFAMILSSLFVGKLLEKYNIKILMMIGVLCCSVCLFIYAIAPSIVYFYAASVLMGISISMTCNIPISIVIKDWFRNKNEGTALGIAFVGSGFGAMILNPLYTYIIENFGWRYSFAFGGACVLVILTPLVLIFMKRNQQSTAAEEVKCRETDNVALENDFTLGEAFKKPQTWAVFIAYTILPFVAMAILNHGVPFMTDNGMSSEKAAMIISYASGVLIIGKIAVGMLYDKLGVYKTNLIEAVLFLVCFIAFWMNGLFDSPILMVLFIVLYGLGIPFATISIQMVLPLMYGKSHFGTLMGMFSIGNGLAGMLQVVISMIYDKTGSYTAAWIMLTALCVLVIFILAICVRPQRKS